MKSSPEWKNSSRMLVAHRQIRTRKLDTALGYIRGIRTAIFTDANRCRNYCPPQASGFTCRTFRCSKRVRFDWLHAVALWHFLERSVVSNVGIGGIF